MKISPTKMAKAGLVGAVLSATALVGSSIKAVNSHREVSKLSELESVYSPKVSGFDVMQMIPGQDVHGDAHYFSDKARKAAYLWDAAAVGALVLLAGSRKVYRDNKAVADIPVIYF